MNAEAEEIEEFLDGLRRRQKSISPKYFYDERGSRLFEDITRLPEYYLTDAEIEIMKANIDEIVARIGSHTRLIELGSGSGEKTRILLEHLKTPAAYVPVDISQDHLLQSASSINHAFPQIEVLPVVADFTQPFEVPVPSFEPRRNIVYFPGSTIGNFEHDASYELLKVMHEEAGEDGALLIGVDLRKDRDVIEAAYNDSRGVTAAFNLNMLRHVNRVFDADFALDGFHHEARYVEQEGRVRVCLVSERPQVVNIGGEKIDIAAGERILTEYSHKYTLEEFAALAASAGFVVDTVWTDRKGYFSVQYCTRDQANQSRAGS